MSESRKLLQESAEARGMRVSGDAVVTFQLLASRLMRNQAERIAELAKARIDSGVGSKRLSAIDVNQFDDKP